MPVQTVKDYLDDSKVKYVCMSHSPAYTAQEIAHTVHITGKKFAKIVIVSLDGKLAMVVIPASENVNLEAVESQTGASDVSLATESEFKDKFPGCELGAMPPFGNLFEMDVYVSSSFDPEDEIAFNAGSHSELIQMAFSDFMELVQPKML